MPPHLTRKDLWSLEEYAERRAEFRARVLAHKQHRQLALDTHARLYFEDALTIRYQVQEMLRIERVFEPAAINEEPVRHESGRVTWIDADRCLPYFVRHNGCSICIAVCPWSTPGRAPTLADRLEKRRERTPDDSP